MSWEIYRKHYDYRTANIIVTLQIYKSLFVQIYHIQVSKNFIVEYCLVNIVLEIWYERYVTYKNLTFVWLQTFSTKLFLISKEMRFEILQLCIINISLVFSRMWKLFNTQTCSFQLTIIENYEVFYDKKSLCKTNI